MDSYALNTPEYIVELWDINNVFIADITALIASSLRITIPLNDIEEIAFTLDLVQFEELCASIGARPINILGPYRTDVKVRRNNKYLLGAHVVQTGVNFNNSDTNKIEVQCTGYLNHLKDRFVSAHYSAKTYAQIARQLITDTQSAYNQISNGDFYEGLSGWQYIESGYIAWNKLVGHDGLGALYVNNVAGPNTFGGARWSRTMQAGVTYTASYWVKADTTGGKTYLQTQTGVRMNETTISTTDWTFITYTWTQAATSDYLDFKMDTNVNFYLDDVKLVDNVDNASNRNFGITLGTDNASANQEATRIRNYDLQNVKDGIINLTKLESDNFDFAFDANKVFTTWSRKGSDKPDVELVYPQNIVNMRTIRSAATMSNKVYALGAGIGEERLQANVIDYVAATTYRVRESTQMFNSVELLPTLNANAIGALYELKDLNDNIELTVNNGTLDLDDVEVGDAIYVRIDGSSYVDYVNGLYRIMKMSIDVTQEFDETVTIVLQKWD